MNTRVGTFVLGTALVSASAFMLVGSDKTTPAMATPTPETTVGTEIDDTVITSSVKSALLADTRVKCFDIAVVTRKDEAQFSGFVNNQDQIDRAIEVARAVEGVRTVTNEMRIKQ